MRSKIKKTELKLEKIADYIFILALVGVLIIFSLVILNFMVRQIV
jgi:hypothetical protein